MSYKISDLQKHNSELLKLLTQYLPDMLWVKDINGKYIYTNKSLCEGLLMAKNIYEPIGKDDIYFAKRERQAHKDKKDWHTFGELCFNSDQIVIEQNRPMKFEEYGNVKGKLLYLEVFKAPFYDEFGNILGTVGAGRDITELKMTQISLEKSLKKLDEQQEKLSYLANHDELTGLPNRRLLHDRLQQNIDKAKRFKTQVAVIFIDLDYFKNINDSFGHATGDKLLIEFSNRLKSKIREYDTIVRLGGDEFCIVLGDILNVEDVYKFLISLMEVIKAPFLIENHFFHVTMSLGVAISPDDGTNVDTLLKNADAALYKSKENGRNKYSFYDVEMGDKIIEKVFLESALREGLKKDQFNVYYQPQLDIKKNKIVGLEALARWEHPTLGIMMPNDFIPLAISTGLIVELDRIIMQKSFREFLKWHKKGLSVGKLSINLSLKQLESIDFMEFLENLILENSIIQKRLEVEITEKDMVKNPKKAIEILTKLSKLGIDLVIDDFGTGYTSLAYLKKIPIKKIKIDKSLIHLMLTSVDDASISKTIINISKNLDINVIAEGVEIKEQESFLRNNGCDLMQGYLYSYPLPVNKIEGFLKRKVL